MTAPDPKRTLRCADRTSIENAPDRPDAFQVDIQSEPDTEMCGNMSQRASAAKIGSFDQSFALRLIRFPVCAVQHEPLTGKYCLHTGFDRTAAWMVRAAGFKRTQGKHREQVQEYYC